MEQNKIVAKEATNKGLISNDLLYSTGNSKYSVMAFMGNETGKEEFPLWLSS